MHYSFNWKMQKLCFVVLLSLNMTGGYAHPLDSLKTIRAFQLVTENLACSGYVTDEQFDYIWAYGFTHVISLLPGDQSHEESMVTSRGMTFKHIPVSWGRPTMNNLEHYIDDMAGHRDEKVYLHCDANMRASAFMFLYRVTQMGVDKMTARNTLYEIWFPTGDWARFIERGLENYGFDPEYRYEPEFIRLIREGGIEYAEGELERLLAESGMLPFTEVDLQILAEEYAADNNAELAAGIYRLNARAFPDSWQVHDQLGSALIESGDLQGATESYRRVLELNPDHVWAKRMLGKLGVEQYAVFWQGVEPDPEGIRLFAGTYDLGNAQLEFYVRGGNFFLQPSWTRRSMQVHADSPTRYFVQENNWMFEFSVSEPDMVIFTMSGSTLTGVRTE
jgi:protein tyrosine phosphatase (PTP) superfamily phosphohydrolase (DUF442 family)